MSQTTESLSRLIQRLTGPELQRIIDPERFGLATIVRVQVTKDFDYADVYVSVLKNSTELIPTLRSNVYHIQQVLNKKIERFRVPKIRFFVDNTGEMAQRIGEKINAM